MNFELTDERQMLQDSLRRYLNDSYTPDVRKTIAESEHGYSREIWEGLAELGVVGALFAESDGGFGGSGFDLALVFEELGRVGADLPLIDTGVLGGGLLAALGNDSQKPLIESVIEGRAQLALAHGEPQSRYALAHVATSAHVDGDGYRLEGQKSVVVNGAAAGHIIVSARTAGETNERDGISLFLVPTDSDGLSLRDYPLASGGHAAELTLENVELAAESLLGEEGTAFEAIEFAHARATAAICAQALGLMETIRSLTTNYLKERKQFGQPIGRFQVLQHRMADVLIEIEQARSAVINLAGHLESDREEREKHVSAAKNLIGHVSRLVAEEGIQMHGGIGMTMEYDLGHLAKRLVLVDHRFGDTTYHLERYIELAVA